MSILFKGMPISLVAVLGFSYMCWGEEIGQGSVPTGPEQRNAPSLQIVRPKHGENFGSASIVIETAVENFELLPPTPYYAEASSKPVGHMHVYIDSNPLIATSCQQLMVGKNIDGKALRNGWHRLVIELVHDNHEVLNPRVWKSIYFYTAREKPVRKATSD